MVKTIKQIAYFFINPRFKPWVNKSIILYKKPFKRFLIMSHSYYKVWLHIVFSTKNREHYLTSDIEENIYNYIRDQFIDLGCYVKIINGMPEHVHCLVQQNPNKTISEVIKQVKGSSSHWINQNNISPFKFSWQTDYGVFSVSESQIDKVCHYIENQKQHHSKKSFQEEYISFLKLHNINSVE